MKTNKKLDKEFLPTFNNAYHFEYASIYSKEPIDGWELNDCTEEIKEYEIESDILSPTRIGILNYEQDDFDFIIIIKKQTKIYGDFWTTDGIFYLEIDDNLHYVPAQEPVECLGNWENEDSATKLDSLSNLYKLEVCLTTM